MWSLPELCKISDICAHSTPVTCVRLSPYGYCRSPIHSSPISPNSHHNPHNNSNNNRDRFGLHVNTATKLTTASAPGSDLIALTTAAGDGVVKAWELPWPCHKEPPSMVTD